MSKVYEKSMEVTSLLKFEKGRKIIDRKLVEALCLSQIREVVSKNE